ncbi:hypothetical protein N7450_010991 [Penicillium hetheringtonii]|uniref:Uncharacterized protein n=1 Tax=Penicillium hetheringtonii TaxID=911720 RepID=A0AAD6GMW8_9EURO|nr:hypothetical protein N7450_010991 [Penicillium hetheringtonii]
MSFIQRMAKRLPSAPSLPIDDASHEKGHGSQRFAFFRRRIRLKGNSSISIPLGFVLLFPCLVIVFILLLFVRHPASPGGILIPAGTPPSIRKISEKHDKVFATGCMPISPDVDKEPRANAAFVVLARNKELEGVIQSLKSIERHFNRWYHYPYVFLNDGDFDDDFKATVKNYTSAPEGVRKQGDAAIMYGGMESYHHMCRFYSGHFYKHPLLMKYEWYWRLEPEIKYFCDITYDPFMKMIEANKTYGFTIAVKELRETVPNIFRYASAYKRKNNLKSKGLWEMFLERPAEPEVPEAEKKEKLPEEILQSEPGVNNLDDIDPEAMEGENYNMCHFWSNFEIARLDWFRSKAYEDFFQMMDRSGGFWMERWGDAPIHSLAAANAPARQLPREPYLEKTTEDEKKRIEEDEYWATPDPVKENGVGCRCRCDTDIVDVEGKQGSCLAEWVEVAGGWASP